MKDERQKYEDEIFKKYLKELEAEQAKLDFYKDKSIGGANAPALRPPDDMFPKDMTQQAMIKKAAEQAKRHLAQEEREQINAAKHKQAMIDHQKKTVERGMIRPTQEETLKRKLSEQASDGQEQERKKGKKLSEQNKKIDFKRKQGRS